MINRNNCLLGDWGLGIGDCPIPNPQSPIPKIYLNNVKLIIIGIIEECNIKLIIIIFILN